MGAAPLTGGRDLAMVAEPDCGLPVRYFWEVPAVSEDREWRKPFYAECRRKHAPPGPRDWANVVATTAGPGEPSRFAPGLSDARIGELCLQAIEEATKKDGAGIELKGGKPHVRCFYWDTGSTVGACGGEVVTGIYVEWQDSGEAHGYPMSENELKRKFKL
jgi:hypothetical protein